MTSNTTERPMQVEEPTDTRSPQPVLRFAAVALVALALGVLGGWLIWGGSDGESTVPLTGEFPTGVYGFDDGPETVEFASDGTCEWSGPGWTMGCTYSVNGDLFTETTFDYPEGVQVPATYYWDFADGELTFELWGDDPRPSRFGAYSGGAFIPVDSP